MGLRYVYWTIFQVQRKGWEKHSRRCKFPKHQSCYIDDGGWVYGDNLPVATMTISSAESGDTSIRITAFTFPCTDLVHLGRSPQRGWYCNKALYYTVPLTFANYGINNAIHSKLCVCFMTYTVYSNDGDVLHTPGLMAYNYPDHRYHYKRFGIRHSKFMADMGHWVQTL